MCSVLDIHKQRDLSDARSLSYETGSLLGMELDRSDNACTVKKRLQLALDVPTEESSLTRGATGSSVERSEWSN